MQRQDAWPAQRSCRHLIRARRLAAAEPLDHPGGALPAADEHGHQAVARASLRASSDRSADRQLRSGRPQRMPERDRPAVRVRRASRPFRAARITATACAANASLSSIRAMSSSVRPAGQRLRDGLDRPDAHHLRLRRRRWRSRQTGRAASRPRPRPGHASSPSARPRRRSSARLLPAVTLPPGAKARLQRGQPGPRRCRGASPRPRSGGAAPARAGRPSSSTTVSRGGPPARPRRRAAGVLGRAARRWLRRPQASCSSRPTPAAPATSSPVRPIPNVHLRASRRPGPVRGEAGSRSSARRSSTPARRPPPRRASPAAPTWAASASASSPEAQKRFTVIAAALTPAGRRRAPPGGRRSGPGRPRARAPEHHVLDLGRVEPGRARERPRTAAHPERRPAPSRAGLRAGRRPTGGARPAHDHRIAHRAPEGGRARVSSAAPGRRRACAGSGPGSATRRAAKEGLPLEVHQVLLADRRPAATSPPLITRRHLQRRSAVVRADPAGGHLVELSAAAAASPRRPSTVIRSSRGGPVAALGIHLAFARPHRVHPLGGPDPPCHQVRPATGSRCSRASIAEPEILASLAIASTASPRKAG